jgi:hypothetical protein
MSFQNIGYNKKPHLRIGVANLRVAGSNVLLIEQDWLARRVELCDRAEDDGPKEIPLAH